MSLRLRLLPGVLAVALVVTTPASGALAAGGGGYAKRAAVHAKARGQSTLAKRLAASVYGARSAGARQRALTRVMRALHVPVFSGRGRPLVHGYRLRRPFYLYGFELETMAHAFATAEGVADLANALSRAGIKPRGKPLDPELLGAVLIAGTRDATRRPNARVSLVPLLVRELGLRRRPRYDLRREVPSARLRFDPLQSFLILYDILTPLAQGSKASGRAAAAAEPCSDPLSQALKGIVPTGKWTLSLVKSLSKPIKAVGIFEDVIHMNILAAAVSASLTTPEEQSTHYGPPGHTGDDGLGGHELRYTLLVVMKLDLGDIVINCGPLIGVKFPKKGPIPGISIIWETAGVAGTPGLENYGTVSYEPRNKTTGPDGRSTLIFTPKNELAPGLGLSLRSSGAVGAAALYQSAFGNIPGGLLQFIDPKGAIGHWNVDRHAPRGLKFSGVYFDWQPYGAFFHDDISGRVCGEDPFASPWRITWTNTNNVNPSNAGTLEIEEPLLGAGIEGLATSVSPMPANWDPLYAPRVTFLSGTPPQMQVERTLATGPHQQVIVPIEEDKTCPTPTP